MKRTVLVLSVLAVVAAFGLASSARAATPQKLTVNVGGGGNGIAANDFFPDHVAIHSGDTIHFVNPYAEIHTVSYLPAGMAMPDLVGVGPSGPPQFGLNPVAGMPTYTSEPAVFDSTKYLNSGVLFQNATADVTFPQVGTFHFVCIVHGAGMSLDVTVGSAADTQAAIDQRGANQLQLLMIKGQQAAATARPAVASTAMADGSTGWNAVIGGSAEEADVMGFFPGNVSVKTGDTVTWTNSTATPHTVTFLSGAALPGLISPVPQAGGPPFLAFNPQLFLPGGGSSYDGTGFTNSGFLQVGAPAQKFSLKFTKPGTYEYVCGLHADQGMKGTITVSGAAPAAATPGVIGAPNTGSGPGAGGVNAGGVIVAALLAAGGALFAFGGTRIGQRRRVG
jgi:plastocyanin